MVSGELYFAVICVVGKSPVDSRGGQLQIAGVVVGQWGANTAGRPGGRGTHVAPQVYSVGPGRSRYCITGIFYRHLI